MRWTIRGHDWLQLLWNHLPWVIAGLLLCWPAIYNGFPLVYSDSGTYINNSFDLRPPPDRAVGYGYFIRIVTWQASIWPVVVAQGLLLSGMIWIVIRLFWQAWRLRIFTGIMLLLVTCSSLPWFVSQIMPDVFAGVLILGMAMLLRVPPRRGHRVLATLAIFLACSVHTSHILVGLGLLGISGVVLLFQKPIRTAGKQFVWMALPVVLAMLFIMGNQAANGNGFRLSRSSNIFMTARIAETGLLEPFLKEHCPAAKYAICDQPWEHWTHADSVLWNLKTSPIVRLGSWEAADAALEPVVSDFFQENGHIWEFLAKGVQDGWEQTQRIHLGDGLHGYHWDDAPTMGIRWRMPWHVHAFLRSRQHVEQLDISLLQRIQLPLMWVGLAVILLLLVGAWRRLQDLRPWAIGILAGLVVNAWVLATLASPVHRYQARISWLLPMVAVMLLIGWLWRPARSS